MASSSGMGMRIQETEAMHIECLVYFGSDTKMTKSSSCLKAGKNLFFPSTSEGTMPTDQGQTVSTGVEEVQASSLWATMQERCSAPHQTVLHFSHTYYKTELGLW